MHQSEGLVWYRLVVDVLATSPRLVMLVRGTRLVELVEEGDVTDDARSKALLIQHRQDTGAAL